MARPKPLSGFPEWLPVERIVEQHILDSLRHTFELHGFASIETRAVEPLNELLRKGETSKEVYVLNRLQELRSDGEVGELSWPDGHIDYDKQLGLHFDQTVPFARYVLENAGKLDFPFKRYQIQKVWRGERPQDGRFREFYQADIDVVAMGELPFHYEVELPLVMSEALAALPIGKVVVLVNNRKVSEGFYRGLGLGDRVVDILHVVDKLDKVGPQAVIDMLVDDVRTTKSQAEACLALADIRGDDAQAIEQAVRALAEKNNVHDDVLDEGLRELVELLRQTASMRPGAVAADLKIARGLDYYTGTVYESVLVGQESLGSICSGGTYGSLVSDGSTVYPGVGLSIGVSRLVSRILSLGLVSATRSVPSAVLVAVADEARREASDRVAAVLRMRGIPCDISPNAAKFGKQIKYADKRGIPFVWFPGEQDEAGNIGHDQVKDIRSGEQVNADAHTWQPPETDLWPRVVATADDASNV